MTEESKEQIASDSPNVSADAGDESKEALCLNEPSPYQINKIDHCDPPQLEQDQALAHAEFSNKVPEPQESWMRNPSNYDAWEERFDLYDRRIRGEEMRYTMFCSQRH